MKKTFFFILAMLSMAMNVLAQEGHLCGLVANDIRVEGDMVAMHYHRMHATFSNPTDSVCSAIVNTMQYHEGWKVMETFPVTQVPYGIPVTLRPGESIDLDYIIKPMSSGEYDILLCDEMELGEDGLWHYSETFGSTRVNIGEECDFLLTGELILDNATENDGVYYVNSDTLAVTVSILNHESAPFGGHVYILITDKNTDESVQIKYYQELFEGNVPTIKHETFVGLIPNTEYILSLYYFPSLKFGKKDVHYCCEPVYFTITDNTSGIESVNATGNRNTPILDLQGKRMAGSIDALPAGIYLIDGKKVVKQ